MDATGDLITIAIRTHDRPTHIVAEAAGSALNQARGGDYEVVVVNSGPDRGRIDSMLARLDPDGRRARQVHVPEAAGNRAASCNAGVRAARGEWIRYLDDDDLLAPWALRAYRRHISTSPSGETSPIVWSDLYWKHAVRGDRVRLVPCLNSAIARRAKSAIERALCAHVGTGTLFARRSLLARHPYDTDYHAAEDAEWLFRMALEVGANMDFLPVITTLVRMQHGDNTNDTVGWDALCALRMRAAARAVSSLRAAGRTADADLAEWAMHHSDRVGRVQARTRLVNACSRSRLATKIYLRWRGVRDAFEQG